MKKILFGSVLAAVVMFIWGGVAHMLLPLGSMGMRELPHSTSVTYAIDLALDEPGLYVFPWMDPKQQMSKKMVQEWAESYREGPVGMLLFRPEGGDPMDSRHFVVQFCTDLAAASIAAVLLSFTALGFVGRVLFVTSLGLFSWIGFSIPYWNWYGFPGLFTLAAGIESVVGWFLAGLVLAALRIGRKPPAVG